MEEFAAIRQRFFNSLKCGTGEAYFIQKDNPHIDFSDLILKAAVTNFAYDKQIEYSRADYIYFLIKKSKHKDRIIRAILKKLQTKKRDSFVLGQMCDLALKCYQAGYSEAKDALHNRFEKNTIAGYDFCGQEQLMAIDGLKGALKVANVVGKLLQEDPDDYEDSWRMDKFQKRNKHIDVYAALKEASLLNDQIKTYYDSILQHKWKRYNPRKIKRFTYELVKEKMNLGRFAFLTSERNNEFSADEVARLANEFLVEKDVREQEKYLAFFQSRKFPFDYQPIFQMAAGNNPKESRLVVRAIEALKHFSSNKIRNLALDKLKTAANPADYLYLLINNYKQGDARLLTEIVNHSVDYDTVHELVFGLIEIYEANAIGECVEPLTAIYRKMNCGLHRNAIVRLMITNNVLSENLLKELEFDSDADTRKLFRQQKKNRTKH